MNGVVESIILQSGKQGAATSLKFDVASVNVFVGPNHAGKSQLLREIRPIIDWPVNIPPPKVLKSLQLAAWDDEAKQALVNRIRAHAKPIANTHPEQISITLDGRGTTCSRERLELIIQDVLKTRDMSRVPSLGDAIRAGLTLNLDGEGRLRALMGSPRGSISAPAIDITSKLYKNEGKRVEVRKIIHEAVGYWLVVVPASDGGLKIRLSETEPPPGVEHSLTEEAVEFFRQCKDINGMSDGVQAFCGIVASVIASDARVIFIDEPEAFLHPELCTMLAKLLCNQARKRHQQLFVATHSAPFLMGCVQAGIDTNIVRLTFRRGFATSHILSQAELAPLMRNPLLRSTDTMAGIFYNSVVVTEADGDRAFYDEINHRCMEAKHAGAIQNCLFLNAQSWQSVAPIVAPLRRLGVAAAAIVDIDVLLEQASTGMQALMEAVNMPATLRKALGQMRGDLHRDLSPIRDDLKKKGLDCVEGEKRRGLESFLKQLSDYGVFLVPGGELESWLPNLPRGEFRSKREWLRQTFESMGQDPRDPSYVHPQDDDVWSWMAAVGRWLADSSRLGM